MAEKKKTAAKTEKGEKTAAKTAKTAVETEKTAAKTENSAAETEKTAEKPAEKKKTAGRRVLRVWVGPTSGELRRFDSGWEDEMLALVEKYAPGREGLLVDPKDAPRAIAEIDAGKGFYSKF